MKLFWSSEISVHRPGEFIYKMCQASVMVQMVTNLPAVWEIQSRSMVLEDPLEKEMATHSSILA